MTRIQCFELYIFSKERIRNGRHRWFCWHVGYARTTKVKHEISVEIFKFEERTHSCYLYYLFSLFGPYSSTNTDSLLNQSSLTIEHSETKWSGMQRLWGSTNLWISSSTRENRAASPHLYRRQREDNELVGEKKNSIDHDGREEDRERERRQ